MVAGSYQHHVSASTVASPSPAFVGPQQRHRRTPSSNNSVRSMPADGGLVGRDQPHHGYSASHQQHQQQHQHQPPLYPSYPPSHQRTTSHSAPTTPFANTNQPPPHSIPQVDGRQLSSRATLQHTRASEGAAAGVYSYESSVVNHSASHSMAAPQQPMQYNSGGSPHGVGRRASVGASTAGSSAPASFRGYDSPPIAHSQQPQPQLHATYHQPPSASSFEHQLKRETARFPAAEWRSAFVDWERLNRQVQRMADEMRRLQTHPQTQHQQLIPSICQGAATTPRTDVQRLDDTYWAILKSEVDKVNTFYLQKQHECYTQFNDLQIGYHFGPNVDSVSRLDGVTMSAEDSPTLPPRDESHSSNTSSTNPSPRPGDRSKLHPPNGHHIRSHSDIALSLRGQQSPDSYQPHTPASGSLARSFDHAHISTPQSHPMTYPRSLSHKRSSSHMSHSPEQRRTPIADPAAMLPPSCPYITSLTFCKLLYQAQPDLARSLLHENVLHESERLSYEVMNATYVMLFNRFLTVCSQLDWLRKFITLNYIIVMKALQQYDQTLQQRAAEVYCQQYLYSEPFYQSTTLTILLGRAEGITQWVVPMRRSIERHSTICMLCHSEYTKPIILNCNHRFCFACLTHNKQFVDAVKCPKCHVEHPIDVRLLHVDSVLSRYVGLSVVEKPLPVQQHQPLQHQNHQPLQQQSDAVPQVAAVEADYYFQMPHTTEADQPFNHYQAPRHQAQMLEPTAPHQPASQNGEQSYVSQNTRFADTAAHPHAQPVPYNGMHQDVMQQEPSPTNAKRARHEQQQQQQRHQYQDQQQAQAEQQQSQPEQQQQQHKQPQLPEPQAVSQHPHHRRHVSDTSFLSTEVSQPTVQPHQPALHVDTDSESHTSQQLYAQSIKQSRTPKFDVAPAGPAPPPIVDRGVSMPAALHRQHSLQEGNSNQSSMQQRSPKSAAGQSAPTNGESSNADAKVGFSCHRCKCTKENEALIHCTLKGKGGRRRECKKKFCKSCLTRIVGPAEAAMAPIGHVASSEWVCPACCGTCKCAACKRKYMWDANKQQQMLARQSSTPNVTSRDGSQQPTIPAPTAESPPIVINEVNANVSAAVAAAANTNQQPPTCASVAASQPQARPAAVPQPQLPVAEEMQPRPQAVADYPASMMQPPAGYHPQQYHFSVPRQPSPAARPQPTATFQQPPAFKPLGPDPTTQLNRLSPTMLDTLKSSLESSLSNYVNSSAGGAALIGGAVLPPKQHFDAQDMHSQVYLDNGNQPMYRASHAPSLHADFQQQHHPSAAPNHYHQQPAAHVSHAQPTLLESQLFAQQQHQGYAHQLSSGRSVASSHNTADIHNVHNAPTRDLQQQHSYMQAPPQRRSPSTRPVYAEQPATFSYSPSISAAPHQRASYNSYQPSQLNDAQINNSQRLFSLGSLNDQLHHGSHQTAHKHSTDDMEYSHDTGGAASSTSNPATSSDGGDTPAPNYMAYGSSDAQSNVLLDNAMMDGQSLEDSYMGLRPTAFNGIVATTPGAMTRTIGFSAGSSYFD